MQRRDTYGRVDEELVESNLPMKFSNYRLGSNASEIADYRKAFDTDRAGSLESL